MQVHTLYNNNDCLLGSNRALRQVLFGQIGHALKVVVTRVAEMRSSKAEEDGDGTAITTLIFKIICTVLWTHLSLRDVAAPSANKFLKQFTNY